MHAGTTTDVLCASRYHVNMQVYCVHAGMVCAQVLCMCAYGCSVKAHAWWEHVGMYGVSVQVYIVIMTA